MEILQLSKLTPDQIEDIIKLTGECEDYNPYYEEESPNGETCFFLCYENGLLISFLSFLAVGTEAEITGMTLPGKRQQGFFSELFKCASSEFHALEINYLYSALPTTLEKSHLCDGISHSEYLEMLDLETAGNLIKEIQVHPIQPHLQLVYKPKNSAYELIDSSGKKPKILGKCYLSKETEFTNIWGVEIKKPYRNMGYGLQFMKLVIQDYFQSNTKPFILNVSSTNRSACKLYARCKFRVVEEIKYYKLIKN